MTNFAPWVANHLAQIMLCLMTAIVVLLYYIWTHLTFKKAENYIEHGMETDPYLDDVREERAAAGSSIAVIITVNRIDGTAQRYYYHSGSETRFRITHDDVLVLDM